MPLLQHQMSILIALKWYCYCIPIQHHDDDHQDQEGFPRAGWPGRWWGLGSAGRNNKVGEYSAYFNKWNHPRTRTQYNSLHILCLIHIVHNVHILSLLKIKRLVRLYLYIWYHIYLEISYIDMYVCFVLLRWRWNNWWDYNCQRRAAQRWVRATLLCLSCKYIWKYKNTNTHIHTYTRNTYTQIQKYSHNLPAKRFKRATLLNFVEDTGVDGGPYAYVELCLQQTLDWRPICLCFSLLMAMTDSRLYHTTPYNTIPNQNIPCCAIQYHDW